MTPGSFRGWPNGFRPRTKNQVVGSFLTSPKERGPTGGASSTSVTEQVPVPPSEPKALLVDRVRGLVEVAGQFGTGIELETLVELLPEYGPSTADDLVRWIRTHPGSGRVSGQRALARTAPDIGPDPSRRRRAEQYARAASRLVASELKATGRWLRFLGITGSAAYGDPSEGDDCDLMVIVRPGTVWVFLAYVFLRLRFRKRNALRPVEPAWCFNYTLDEEAANRAFSRPRGFLFAREALVTRPVEGEAYYRSLLHRGAWLRQEAPRLYARWQPAPLPEPTEPEPASRGVRWLNAVLFPIMAAYLQLKSLWSNHRLQRSGRDGESFRTITRLDRMALATRKFERLSYRMRPASRLPPE